MASKAPVEAPEGTAARPVLPSSRPTSTSTVGLPRESRISRATTTSMDGTSISFLGCDTVRRDRGGFCETEPNRLRGIGHRVHRPVDRTESKLFLNGTKPVSQKSAHRPAHASAHEKTPP